MALQLKTSGIAANTSLHNDWFGELLETAGGGGGGITGPLLAGRSPLRGGRLVR